MSEVIVHAGDIKFEFPEGSVGWSCFQGSETIMDAELLFKLRSKVTVEQITSTPDVAGEYELFLTVLDFVEFMFASGVDIKISHTGRRL